jgi:hypothetical protein
VTLLMMAVGGALVGAAILMGLRIGMRLSSSRMSQMMLVLRAQTSVLKAANASSRIAVQVYDKAIQSEAMSKEVARMSSSFDLLTTQVTHLQEAQASMLGVLQSLPLTGPSTAHRARPELDVEGIVDKRSPFPVIPDMEKQPLAGFGAPENLGVEEEPYEPPTGHGPLS